MVNQFKGADFTRTLDDGNKLLGEIDEDKLREMVATAADNNISPIEVIEEIGANPQTSEFYNAFKTLELDIREEVGDKGITGEEVAQAALKGTLPPHAEAEIQEARDLIAKGWTDEASVPGQDMRIDPTKERIT